jgi:hypothetical protein
MEESRGRRNPGNVVEIDISLERGDRSPAGLE